MYNSYVRSYLECDSPVWIPQYQKYVIAIESIQNKYGDYFTNLNETTQHSEPKYIII